MVSRHQLRQAIEVIEQANNEGFKEITEELTNTISRLKKQLDETDAKWKLLNDDIGKSQILYKFDEKYFSNLQINHSIAIKNFLENWMQKQSDWRYPICFLSPSVPMYLEHCVKSNLVYVLTNNFSIASIKNHVITTLKKHFLTSQLNQYRIKPLFHEGMIENKYVPYNQIGNIVSYDYFPYLSIKQIENYFESFEKILRPGGSAILHITDADCEQEWQSVVEKKITYCTIDIVQNICKSKKLILKNYYHIDSMYTFFHIQKPGILQSQKISATKIEKVR